jgi:opacity protein-like surface antigen
MKGSVIRGGRHMIRVTFGIIAAVVLGAGTPYALGLAFGGTYFLGIPVGESKITAVHVDGKDEPVNMTDGWPLKMSPANFALTSLVTVTPLLNVEAGFELHTGYYNKVATINYGEGPSYVEPEDNVKWSLIDIYAGPRLSFRPGGKVRPFAAGGIILGRSKYELKELEGNEVEVRSSGPAFGWYAGAGGAVYLSDKIILTFPVKFNMLFGAEYSYEGPLENSFNDWKPGPYVTAGIGITYAAFDTF